MILYFTKRPFSLAEPLSLFVPLLFSKLKMESRTKSDDESWHGERDVEEMSLGFRTYKMRFFGLVVIALCNIASSLNWLAVAPIPNFSNDYFGGIGLTAVNWFSNVFMLVYIFAGPLSSYVYEHWDIKMGVGCLDHKKVNI